MLPGNAVKAKLAVNVTGQFGNVVGGMNYAMTKNALALVVKFPDINVANVVKTATVAMVRNA